MWHLPQPHATTLSRSSRCRPVPLAVGYSPALPVPHCTRLRVTPSATPHAPRTHSHPRPRSRLACGGAMQGARGGGGGGGGWRDAVQPESSALRRTFNSGRNAARPHYALLSVAIPAAPRDPECPLPMGNTDSTERALADAIRGDDGGAIVKLARSFPLSEQQSANAMCQAAQNRRIRALEGLIRAGVSPNAAKPPQSVRSAPPRPPAGRRPPHAGAPPLPRIRLRRRLLCMKRPVATARRPFSCCSRTARTRSSTTRGSAPPSTSPAHAKPTALPPF